MSEWYNDLYYKDFKGKHVLVTYDDGTAIMGAVTYGVLETRESGREISDCYVRLMPAFAGIGGEHTEGTSIAVLVCMEDDRWRPLDGVKSVDLVWDERDWDRIDAKDLRCGDAVVANGVLYEVSKASLVHTDYPCVGTDALGRNPIDLRLVSCALRRKVNVPAKPGFYKDTLGEFWARTAKPAGDGPWRSVEPDALDQPAKSDKYMSNLMPLTPVHFVDGRAPEPGDELASVMRITSKGVTFTTEAA
ncbi:hypothetical protein H3T86_00405 [Bifidobacterium sp. W8113]|uniref:hypothetical protein n=1 Tax=Bifidobacterium choladohabitans TaxID=2750947 RepID=UPI0018DE16A0|nr:hypothetical protein [Bifidobacterium choladohabitans]MBI0089181.1 hypothetical protein [Bifidobacterium choladohabitans]